jgi:2-C-methyl-D-erythritol 4-phosphate cytidylyltransferase
MRHLAIIILAGGSGTRFNQTLPKQFLKITNRPVLYYPIKAFLEFLPKNSGKIITVAPKEYIIKTQKIMRDYFKSDLNRIDVITGGKNRIFSQFNAIDHIRINYTEIDTVIVHDAVRPLITVRDIRNLYRYFLKMKFDICFIAKSIHESLFHQKNDKLTCMNRTEFVISQTPFIYKLSILEKILEQYNLLYENRKELHLDFHMLEFLPKRSKGVKVGAIKIANPNTKLTTREDVAFIRKAIQKQTWTLNQNSLTEKK